MSKVYRYFGYGSLINTESLLATVPDARNVRPGYIKGFRRDFSIWDPIGWTQTNLDVAGEPFCGLDVMRESNQEARVNGVVFELSEGSLSALIEREREYEVIQTLAYDYDSSEEIGVCYLFSAGKNNGNFLFKSPAQIRYLEVCVNSCDKYGEKFKNEFEETTYINGKSLKQYSVF